MQIKGITQKLLNHLGYRLSRIEASQSQFVPRREHFDGGPVQFDYWIPERVYESWYNSSHWAVSVEYQQLVKLVKLGDRVLEIGCNIGFTTMILSQLVGEYGLVLGVDLIPGNVLVAQSNAFMNGATNVRLLHAAVGESIGEIGFVNEENGYVLKDSPAKVPMTTCDALDGQYGPFNVMKVDVEGYEFSVLKGAEMLLGRTPKMALEVHGQGLATHGITIGQLMQQLNVERYGGQMFTRPDYLLREFELQTLVELDSSITNVFLESRSL